MTTTLTSYPPAPPVKPRSRGTHCDLLEIAYSDTSRVNREAGIIYGVRVLGLRSGNRGIEGKPRRYDRAAVARSIGLYESVAVYWKHPDRRDPGARRREADRAGQLKNVRQVPDGGLVADLHLLLGNPRTAVILEAAERSPDMFGLSHNARGRENLIGGESVVSEIDLVRSVDIVADPATTSSLFESCGCGCHDKADCGGFSEADAKAMLKRAGLPPRMPLVAAVRRAKPSNRAALVESFRNVQYTYRTFQTAAEFAAALKY